MLKIIDQFLCLFGFHDYRLVDKTIAFGPSGSVETLQCRRCGLVVKK